MNLTMAVDYCDLIHFDEKLFTEEPINRMLGGFAERGFTDIQWRVSVMGRLLYRTQLGDGVADGAADGSLNANDVPAFAATFDRCAKKMVAVLEKEDPMEVASRLCRKHGLKFYPWLTIYDDAGFHPVTWSNLVRKHPEYCWKSIDSEVYYHGMTSYVYPEVVDYRLAQIKELLSYDVAGIHLCTRSHSRPPGWTAEYMKFMKNPDHTDEQWHLTPMAKSLSHLYAKCQGRFGFDHPAVAAYESATGKSPQPDDANWWKFRGGYLIDFLRKAKKLAYDRNVEVSFGPRFEHGIYPKDFFDWKRMLDEGIIDELHYGATDDFCGLAEVPREWPEFMKSPGRKNYFHCVKGFRSADEHIKGFEATGNAQVLNRFDGITMFEAYIFELYPDLWRFVDHLKKAAA